MNEKEFMEFFKKIEGKKIRWNGWGIGDRDVYALPYKTAVGDEFHAEVYKNSVLVNSDKLFSAAGGLGTDGWQWTIISDQEAPAVHHSNDCECGAAKIWSSHHYDWCPKYVRQ